MKIFALASELHRLAPVDAARVTHVIADDGEWPSERITAYLARWRDADILADVHGDDWTTKAGELL